MAVASDRNNPRRELVIRPGHHDSEYVPDLWRYRELFYFLAWRDILVRYKQTAIGAAWAIVKPLLTIVVLSYIFGKLAGMPADGVPYPILVAAAMLPWQFFASSVSDCSNSLLAGSELVAKVYFPRLILPGSSMVVNLIDFAVSCVILVGLFIAYRFVPGPAIFAVPLFLLLAAVTAAGLGLWFAALIVRYRDIRHLVPFLLQLGLFASPVGFSSDVVPDAVAAALCTEPDGRRDRRFPLVDPRRRARTRCCRHSRCPSSSRSRCWSAGSRTSAASSGRSPT